MLQNNDLKVKNYFCWEILKKKEKKKEDINVYCQGAQPSAVDHWSHRKLPGVNTVCSLGKYRFQGSGFVQQLAFEQCLVTTGSPNLVLSLVTRNGCVNRDRNVTKRAYLPSLFRFSSPSSFSPGPVPTPSSASYNTSDLQLSPTVSPALGYLNKTKSYFYTRAR